MHHRVEPVAQEDPGEGQQRTELPFADLKAIAARLISEVPGINRVVFDLTSKPPGTIEWE